MELVKLQRQRAVDAVYQALREGILTHLFKPGERLHVDLLSQKLGVSLTPVRNAIQQLSTEGLVEIHPRSGTFVASLSQQDIQETFEIRCALECLAAEKSTELIEAGELARLKELLVSMRRPINTPEARKAHEQDNSEFHRILIRGSRNRRLEEMYDSLNAHLKIARIHSSDENWESRLTLEQSEHEAIVDALEKREVERVVATLRTHIYRAKDALVASLGMAEAHAAGE